MYYLDTSFLVAAFCTEMHTDKVRQWLRDTPPDDVFFSSWTVTEFSSAVSLKIRTKQIQLEERAIILSNWRDFIAESAAIIAVDSKDFDTAEAFASNHHLALRAGDALHLAVAKSAGCTVVTLDRRMAAAALELGVEIVAGIVD